MPLHPMSAFRAVAAHAALSLGLLAPTIAGAAGDGDLERSFGDGGRRVLETPAGPIGFLAGTPRLHVQADGRLVVAGTCTISGVPFICASRRLADGRPDPGFASQGWQVQQPDISGWRPVALAVRANGNVIVAGDWLDYASIGVCELTATFGNGACIGFRFTRPDGTPLDSTAAAIALDASGRLLVAGTARTGSSDFDLGVVRIQASLLGGVDPGFGSGGTRLVGYGELLPQVERARDLALRPDGRIVVIGDTMPQGGPRQGVVVQLTASGALDADFGAFGTAYYSNGPNAVGLRALAIDAAGRIVIAGSIDRAQGSGSDFWVNRLRADGVALDTTFGASGNSILAFDLAGTGADHDQANDVVVEPNGRIAVAGEALVAAGRSTPVVVRLLDDGSPDPRFGGAGRVVVPFFPGLPYDERATAVALAPGRLLLAGTTVTDTGAPGIVLAALELDRILVDGFE